MWHLENLIIFRRKYILLSSLLKIIKCTTYNSMCQQNLQLLRLVKIFHKCAHKFHFFCEYSERHIQRMLAMRSFRSAREINGMNLTTITKSMIYRERMHIVHDQLQASSDVEWNSNAFGYQSQIYCPASYQYVPSSTSLSLADISVRS